MRCWKWSRVGKSLRLIRAPRPLERLDDEPTGFADAGYDF
jgi:hypothetical protein